MTPFRLRLAQALAGPTYRLYGESAALAALAQPTSRVDDGPGWRPLSYRPHERDGSEIEELYNDALTAWRKNPLAKRAVDITADYVIGDGITLASPFAPLAAFADAFWHHPRNRIPNRLETMCHELTLAGDLFPVLFRNPHDGMSYLRFTTKDRIAHIATMPQDWETEIAYEELPRGPGDRPRTWLAPDHPAAHRAGAVMLHYSVNRPLGALLGEGDLATMIPWLLRYSRMLEDRVRFHWATRAFLWFVRVPTHLVHAKQEQYREPPEAGSIVVADDAEEWEPKAPRLNAADAAPDLEAVRRMVFTGSSFPPHWYGEPGSNRAEAAAMQAPAERHLRRRQQYFVWLLEDLVYQAYNRARESRTELPALPGNSYHDLFTPAIPDISRQDNADRAMAAARLASIWNTLILDTAPKSRRLTELLLSQIFRFMGEPQTVATVAAITDDIFHNLDRAAAPSPIAPNGAAAAAAGGGRLRANG